MPTLNWIGKAAVVEHHKEVPFRLLKCRDDFSVGDPQAGNLLVQGDNLEALKALLPYYAGQVKCIYIDPPYNTGNEGWVYNDAVNSPEMRDWLGNVVGGEAEDLSRHDKWLCMMYPRLALLRDLLSEDGSLWMSLDDNEVQNARGILDEIFGAQNFISTIIWEKSYAAKSSAKYLSDRHEYVILYAKNKNFWARNLLPRTEQQDQLYKNPDNDPRGLWRPNNLAARNYYSKGTYSITTPGGRVVAGPPKGSYWRVSEERLWEMHKEGRIWWGEDGNNIPAPKIYLTEVKQGLVPETMWFFKDVGHSQEGKKEIIKLLPSAENVFMTPKPTRLIQRILQIATNPNDLVLDSFAGSGTTGHAVLKQNAEDGGSRRFILVEMDTNIAPNITAERLKRVVQGYTFSDQNGNEKTEAGLGGGFRFCELGATLFDPTGQIRPEVKYEDLAQHIHFIETGSPLPRVDNPQYPLLGVHNGLAIYLLYNGVLKDKSPHGGNVLTYELLETLPSHDGLKVIYGNGCRIGEQRLRDLGIVFKQIPYEIREK
jgi:site-specific DNA-methyltransferase (adenine-specific)/adenine-specific DNA-methyltransferase